MTKAKHLLRWLLQLFLDLVWLAAACYIVSALATGRIPPRFQDFVVDGGVLGVLSVVFFGQRYRERRFLGSTWRQPFALQPGEELVFSTYRVSVFLYPRAEDYTPRIPLGVMLDLKKASFYGSHVRLRLTNRRLMLRSLFGNTWRLIPLPSIERVTEAPRRFPLSIRRVVISYRLEGRGEVLVIEDKRVKGRTLKDALLELNPLAGGASRPLWADLPNKIVGS